MGQSIDASQAAGALAEELWRHPDPSSTPMWHFIQRVNQKRGLSLSGYPDLYRWSVDRVADFWEDVWHFVGVVASKPYDQVSTGRTLTVTQGSKKTGVNWA